MTLWVTTLHYAWRGDFVLQDPYAAKASSGAKGGLTTVRSTVQSSQNSSIEQLKELVGPFLT